MKIKTTVSLIAIGAIACLSPALAQSDLREAIAADYDANLAALFTHFHENPEIGRASCRERV